MKFKLFQIWEVGATLGQLISLLDMSPSVLKHFITLRHNQVPKTQWIFPSQDLKSPFLQDACSELWYLETKIWVLDVLTDTGLSQMFLPEWLIAFT